MRPDVEMGWEMSSTYKNYEVPKMMLEPENERELAAEAAELELLFSRGKAIALPYGETKWGRALVCPSPTRVTVSGFSPHSSAVASLPTGEQTIVRKAADLIIRSFRPRCQPIIAVRLVGHTDHDPFRERREPGFMMGISRARALAVKQALERRINNRAISSRIAWDVRGAGASRLVARNPTTEAGRRHNHRVEIWLSGKIDVLEFEGPVPGPPPDPRGETASVVQAIALGNKDESQLADLIFHKRHPERQHRPLNKDEKTGIAEWLKIRDDIVRPPLFKKFFQEYDFRFFPDLILGVPANKNMTQLVKDQRLKDVKKVLTPLKQRAQVRSRASKQNPAPVGTPLSTAEDVEAAKRISSAQIDLITEFFRMPNGAIRWRAFQQAFEQFANGELRDPARGAGAGEPNSNFYFLFAEFAWLCVESAFLSNADKSFWGKALTTFVKTQEIFVRVYRPNPPNDLYKFDQTQKFNEDQKRKLRVKYDQMTLSELRKAMGDNIRGKFM
jgi:hypothetical protein